MKDRFIKISFILRLSWQNFAELGRNGARPALISPAANATSTESEKAIVEAIEEAFSNLFVKYELTGVEDTQLRRAT